MLLSRRGHIDSRAPGYFGTTQGSNAEIWRPFEQQRRSVTLSRAASRGAVPLTSARVPSEDRDDGSATTRRRRMAEHAVALDRA
jgi:hypothetical protein